MGFPDRARAMTFIVTRDRERARSFYSGILGFAASHEDAFALVIDLNGTTLRISTVSEHVPQPHTVLGWEVDDIAATVRGLINRGVAFRLFDGLEQDAPGIWTAPGDGARVAWFPDGDGNLLSLFQSGCRVGA